MVRAEKGQFPFSIPQPRRSYQACTLLECGATSDCIASCKKFQIKAGAKTLRIHFGCDFNSVEASLSLTVLLLLKHPQTTHSLLSMRCGKLSHPDALTQAPTCCLYLCDYFADIALLERHFFYQMKKKGSVWNSCSPDFKIPGSLAITVLATLPRSIPPPPCRSHSQHSRSVAFGR